MLDGRTLQALIEVTSSHTVGGMFGHARPGRRCADIVVVTYLRNDFALTRLGPRGEVLWSTRPGSVRTRDVGGAAGCAAEPKKDGERTPARSPRRPVLPATGALPLALPGLVIAAAAVAARRRAA